MPFNRFLDSLRLDADVVLCGGCGAVLQKPLDKGDIIAVVLVDFGGVPFPKAVGTDPLIAQIMRSFWTCAFTGNLRELRSSEREAAFIKVVVAGKLAFDVVPLVGVVFVLFFPTIEAA